MPRRDGTAAILGIIPESGPHLVFVTIFADVQVPSLAFFSQHYGKKLVGLN